MAGHCVTRQSRGALDSALKRLLLVVGIAPDTFEPAHRMSANSTREVAPALINYLFAERC
jgi:hypothetical protein